MQYTLLHAKTKPYKNFSGQHNHDDNVTIIKYTHYALRPKKVLLAQKSVEDVDL